MSTAVGSPSGAPRRRINFLLASTALFGGTKVALHQANLLSRRGHAVTVVTPGERPDWYPIEAAFLQVRELAPAHLPAADVTVATFWTTLAAAAAAEGRALHYCQGFEASYTHNHAEHEAILAAYALPLPAVVVSAHLGRLLAERFGRSARVVPQPIEPFFRPRVRLGPARPPRILIAGPFEIDWKGVATALEAVARARARGLACRLERLSQWPLSEPERRLLEPDAFHCGLTPPEVACLMRRCDLLVAASWEQEGFGLPALEAMASGLPVVASDVACYRDFAADGAFLAPPRDPDAFAGALCDVLRDRGRWRELRRRGLAVAARFGEEPAAAALEAAVEWALAMDRPPPPMARPQGTSTIT